MKGNFNYEPSRLLSGEGEFLRENSFTRWMSRDLLQATTDFLKNIGLVALYAESSTEGLYRYLCWRAPEGWGLEVRSGRTLEQFEEFDLRNVERGWPLLSLHVNARLVHSAVWIAPHHFELAKKFLAAHGITPAERKPRG